MKALISILAAGAILALAAPMAASAGTAKTAPHRGTHAGSAPAAHKGSGKLATHKSSAGKSLTVPRMIVVVPQEPVTSGSPVDECSTYMVSCTGEQYCDIWGFNCGSVGNDASPEPEAAPLDSTTRDGSTT